MMTWQEYVFWITGLFFFIAFIISLLEKAKNLHLINEKIKLLNSILKKHDEILSRDPTDEVKNIVAFMNLKRELEENNLLN
jgi:hypothetical protein